MSELENTLIDKAVALHQKIYPCAKKERFADCFTIHENRLFFWYNTEDQSTHVLYIDVTAGN
ncbi:MAG: hypothetical protein JW915_11625 [Chitinispirillaceae bacterium]|nr:hypothetical protein [Chitinispirillaceae bacterium]